MFFKYVKYIFYAFISLFYSIAKVDNKDNILPILVLCPVKIVKKKSSKIEINGRLRIDKNISKLCKGKTRIILDEGAKLIINGRVTLGPGISIYVAKNAKLVINNNSYITGESKIYCKNYIEIGESCAISFNVVIMDSDLHNIYVEGERINVDSPVIIKDRVWIGCNTTILKGSFIESGSIIGAGSLVNKHIKSNCIAAGSPCKVIKENIEKWQ